MSGEIRLAEAVKGQWKQSHEFAVGKIHSSFLGGWNRYWPHHSRDHELDRACVGWIATAACSAFLRRRELDRTGIYFLTGPDREDSDTLQIYIGESDNVRKRLVQHSKDENKDFWERTCVVTSKDRNITKAHARYLEFRADCHCECCWHRRLLSTGQRPPPVGSYLEADAVGYGGSLSISFG